MGVKEKVGEFYRIAKDNNWGGYNVRPNQLRNYRRDKGHCGYYDPNKEGCPSSAIHQFIDGPVLQFRDYCDDMSSGERNTFATLGLTLKDQCFWCLEYPGSGGMGYTFCLIRNGDRDLTEDEMWFPDLKQRAIDLGYEVRNAPYEASIEGCMNWGIFGAEIAESYSNFQAFTKEAKIRGMGASRYPVSGGYVWCFRYLSASSMAAVTQPICTEGAHEVLEYCPDGVTEKRWRDCIAGKWVYDSRICPECPEGAHEVLEYCPDGVTEKRWRDCINGFWVENSQECPPPSKKDTKIKCYDKTTDAGKKVTLEAKLEEAALPYNDIKDGLVMFYVAGIYVGYDHTDADGKAYTDYTPASAGTFTIKAVFEAAGDYNGSEGEGTLTVKKPVVTQKVIVIGSGGFLGLLTFSGLGLDFPVTRRERIKTVQFGRDMDRLTIATLFVNAGKAELSINGEKVADAWAKHNQIETKAVLLKGGEGIPTEGKDLEIELTCTHVIGSGLKYAACATIVGIKEG